MKKLFAIAFLSLASSFAFATGPGVLEEYKPAPAAEVSAATDKTTPTAMQQGVTKVGSFIGSMLKTPAMLGKAFAGGVGAGFKGTAAPAQAVSKPESASSTKLQMYQEPVTANTDAPPATVSSKHPLAAAFASMLRRPQTQTKAPVEERSAPATADERQPLASTLY